MELSMNQESSSEEMSPDLFMNLKLDDEEKEREIYESKEEVIEEEEDSSEEDDEDDDSEEEFSFSVVFDEANTSQITAEEAFSNGQIRPIFPLFNQDLLLIEGVVRENLVAKDRSPNVKKVFVETDSLPATASTSGNGVEVAPDGCKKSNSTGFSKIWRFKDFMHRSSSDGRDAFVFLNNNTASSGLTMSTGNKEEKTVSKSEKKNKKKEAVAESTVNGDVGKVKPSGEKNKGKAKKLVKSKTTVAVSAHEVYLKSKAREQDRRRSYLPYRPGVVGFFTNITGGGLTKNVHPY